MSKKSFGSIIKKPNGTLYVKYIDSYVTVDGKKKPHYKVESTGSTSKRVAQTRLDELERTFKAQDEKERIEKLVKKSKEIQLGIDENKNNATCINMWSKFLEVLKGSGHDELTRSTMKVYRCAIGSFSDFMTRHNVEYIKDIDAEAIKKFLAMKKDKVKEATFAEVFTVLRRAFNLFVGERLIVENPFNQIKVNLKVPRVQKRNSLDDDDIKMVLEREKPDRIQFLCVCSLTTGMRLIDCCHVRWSDIDLTDATIQTHSIKTQKHNPDKMIKCRIHPMLMTEIDKALKTKKDGDEFVYQDNVTDYRNGTMFNTICRMFQKLGLNKKHKTFHSLRHTFVSTLINNGTPIPVVERLVGHSSVKMSMAYFHENQSVIDSAISSIPSYGEGGTNGSTKKMTIRVDADLVERLEKMGKTGDFNRNLKLMVEYIEGELKKNGLNMD